jgi:glycine hydroxymethyltransferase
MASELKNRGFSLVSGGTDNHMVLVDLHPQNVTGSKVEVLCDAANITLNRNMVRSGQGNASALAPKGIRMGTPAITTRGYTEKDII